MTHHQDDQLAGWLTDGLNHGPVGALEDALARVRSTRQRPAWMVSAAGGTIAQQPPGSITRFAIIAVTVVALIGLLVGAMIVGGVLPPSPNPSIAPLPSADPSAAEPTPVPTEAPPIGLVAYLVGEDLEPGQGACTESGRQSWCFVTRIWIANADGSDAHPFHPGDFVGERLITWAPDGSSLLYQDATIGDLVLAKPDGTVLRRWAYDDLCANPCVGAEELTFSPDGTRLAFVRRYPDVDNGSVIAIFDIATGEVTELDSTYTTNPDDLTRCAFSTSCEGINDVPRWSPDGTRLAFARQTISPEPGAPWLTAIVFTVNADGSELHQHSPEGFYAIDPHWSPDGSRLVFMNDQQIVNAEHTTVERDLFDIYIVLPGGVERLTSDGISVGPEWTTDGRLTFYRFIVDGDTETYENWIMDADGGNVARLGSSLADLTAAGCTTCLWPLPVPANQGPSEAYWQPMP